MALFPPVEARVRMTAHIVVLSGRIASGKSTIRDELVSLLGAHSVGTSALLKMRAARSGAPFGSRTEQQVFGAQEDSKSGGAWIAEELSAVLHDRDSADVVVVDAIRQVEQLHALRSRYGRAVLHVHLTAGEAALRARYAGRGRAADQGSSYEQVSADPIEAKVETLAPTADLLVDTSVTAVRDVITLCAARLGLLARLDRQLVDVLVGGEYGSEGKGNVAFYLAPEYDVLVRVGGPNAGHKVPTIPSTTHRSLPSGSLANLNARLLIGAGALVSAAVLRREIEDSGVDPRRVSIDPDAMVVSLRDRYAERGLRDSIRSTGQGVGNATSRRILGRGSKTRLAKHDKYLAQFVSRPVVEILEDAFLREQRVFLEGTQGAGLSLFHGTYPFVTSRDTSVAACLSEAGIGPARLRKTVMVIRSYPIRVNGARSGPMNQEIDWDTVASRSGLSADELKADELSSVTKRLRRVGEFDWKLLRSSAQLNTPTDIALTFADYISKSNRDAYRFDQLDPATRQLIDDIETVASAPVSLITGRFSDRSVIDRRRWKGSISARSEIA